MRLHLSKFFIINQQHYKLRFYPTTLSRELWIDPTYWDRVWKFRAGFFWDYLRSGDKVIDVGAHIGTISLESAAKVGTSGKVYSIEAHPKIFNFLQGNILLNSLENVETFNVAVGNDSGLVTISDIRTDPSNAIIKEKENGIKVKLSRLDDLQIHESEIAILKLYVVGYEKFVLLGADRILNITKCIHFSIYKSEFEKYGYTQKDVFDILVGYGFKLFRFSKKNEICPLSQEIKPKAEEILGIKDIDDFVNRTGYKILTS